MIGFITNVTLLKEITIVSSISLNYYSHQVIEKELSYDAMHILRECEL